MEIPDLPSDNELNETNEWFINLFISADEALKLKLKGLPQKAKEDYIMNSSRYCKKYNLFLTGVLASMIYNQDYYFPEPDLSFSTN